MAGITEFEILKARHKFLREDEEEAPTWDDQLARKYYENLYREFAICDLKHFKSGNFSLRWRTEEDVLDGTGETTCGNSRCEFHRGRSRYSDAKLPQLTTLELPFAYVEQGESKSALVKVVLCQNCVKKLMWKRNREKEVGTGASEKEAGEGRGTEKRREESEGAPRSRKRNGEGTEGSQRDMRDVARSRRRRSSRSRSPRGNDQCRRRSP